MITVYSVPGSPYGRSVMTACVEKQVPYRLERPAGGSKSPEHLARHPFGRIPAIDHDGFSLFETQAIIRYLDAIGEGPSLTPADPKAAALMNRAIGVIDCYFFDDNSAKTLVFNRVVAPKFGMPTDEAAVERSIPRTRQSVEAFARLLGEGPYLAGEAFSLADIHAGCHFEMFTRAPEGAVMVKGTPIEPWLARLEGRPSFKATTWEQLLQAA